jgi:hypothetical protein
MGEFLVLLGIAIAVVGVYFAWRQVHDAKRRAEEQRRRDDPNYQAQALRDLAWHRRQFRAEFSKLPAFLDELEAIRERMPIPLPSSREFRLASGAFGARQGDFEVYQRNSEQFFAQLQSTINEIYAARSALSSIRHQAAVPLSARLMEIGDILHTLETDVHIPMQQVQEVLDRVRELAFEFNEIQLSD